MKIFVFTVALFCSVLVAQEMKWKHFKLKSSNLNGWNVKEYPGGSSWDDAKNEWCSCAALYFFKNWKNKKLCVLVYPTLYSLDSAKYHYAGAMKFIPVEKYEQIRNKNFSFKKERSEWNNGSGKKFDAIRYTARKEKTTYIIYTWAETPEMMDPDTEKELYALVNSLEPL